MRALLADAVAVAILATYGTEACSFIHELGVLGCAAHLAVAFAVAHAAGAAIARTWIDGGPEVRRAGRTYWLALGRHVAAALTVAAYNAVALGFPAGSGLRLTLGALTLGHFLAADLALAKEREVMSSLAARGHALVDIERPRSFVRRVVLFGLGAVVSTASIIALLLVQDLALLAEAGMDSLPATLHAVLVEVFAVGGILLALGLLLLTSFARNLRQFLENETSALERVRRGELDGAVAVLSDDEFGVIAAHTNRMIEGLRERRRVREVLGKIVSPDVARALLEEQGLSLGGRRRTVTLLFSDVRNFTSWSEGTDPEVLVRDLNRYFTEMVRIVHAEGGIVDKFIGDGLMAVFGLDDRPDATSAAARAAKAMLRSVESLNRELERPIAIGVGIHHGVVVAGNIGSPDRLEFTVIGDAVNTAARIESLTRALGASALLSRAAYDELDELERGEWESRGARELKGKSETVEVFALRTEARTFKPR